MSQSRTTKSAIALLCLVVLACSTLLGTNVQVSDNRTASIVGLIGNGAVQVTSFTGSSNRVSFAGTYTIQIAGLPSLQLTADAQNLSFRGCNLNSFPY